MMSIHARNRVRLPLDLAAGLWLTEVAEPKTVIAPEGVSGEGPYSIPSGAQYLGCGPFLEGLAGVTRY